MTTPYGPELNRLAALWSAQPRSTYFAPLAEALRKRGALEQATAVAATGVAACPDYLPGRLVMARIYRDQGQRESAVSELRAALALDGSHPVVLQELNEVVRHEVVTIPPEPNGHVVEAVADDGPPDDESMEYSEDDVELLPDAEPVLTESLAMLYRGQGHLEQAVAVLDALVARAPDDASLAARRDAVRVELEIARPRPYDAMQSGGRPVRDWLSSLATSRGAAPPPPSSFDAFYKSAGPPPAEAGDLAAFHAWLRELDR